MSCKGRGFNIRCKSFPPPSSLSSPNVRWSLISASSPNVCRAHRQDQEGAATRCVCLDDFEVLQLFFRAAEDFARMARAPHSCQQQ